MSLLTRSALPLLVLVIAVTAANCTIDRRMQHIRFGATTEREWYVRGGGTLNSAPAAAPLAAPEPKRETVVVKPTPPEAPSPLPPDERIILAVMDIEDTSRSIDPAHLEAALEMLRGKLAATGFFMVIDRSRQKKKLDQIVDKQKRESYKQCYDAGCQIPLGQALAADSILRTTISCLGTACMFSSELVSLEKEAAVAGATADFENTPVGLKKAIDQVVDRLVRSR